MGRKDIRKIRRIEKNEDRNIKLNNERKKENKREVKKYMKQLRSKKSKKGRKVEWIRQDYLCHHNIQTKLEISTLIILAINLFRESPTASIFNYLGSVVFNGVIFLGVSSSGIPRPIFVLIRGDA